MVRTEGPRSLYNGLVAGLQRQMSFASVRIGLYDSMKQFYTRGTESEFRCVALTRSHPSACLDLTNKHAASQALGLSLGSWRAAPQEPWPWPLRSRQMWWRCVSKPRCGWLTEGGGTTARWTPTRRLPETRECGAFGEVTPQNLQTPSRIRKNNPSSGFEDNPLLSSRLYAKHHP